MTDEPRVEVRRTDELLHDPGNVRTHDERNLRAIKASLARFGQQKPIVIRPDGVVVAGNGTLAAARELGWETLTCVVTELEGPEAVAFAIADNRTAELAAWDDSGLLAVLESFDEVDEGAPFLEDLAFPARAVAALRDRVFAASLVHAEGEGDAGEEDDDDPYKHDEALGIERVAAPLTLQIVVDVDQMAAIDEAVRLYRKRHGEAPRDLAILAIIEDWKQKEETAWTTEASS